MTNYTKLTCSTFSPDPKPEKEEKKKKPKIKVLSNKREQQNKLYLSIRKVFLEGKKCVVCQSCEAQDVHHKMGRIGDLLINIKYFLAVCRHCHTEIEKNTTWAYENGYSLKRNTNEKTDDNSTNNSNE